MFNGRLCSSLPVTQLQVTLASVQELLVQQQQKVQELAHELATAKVLVPTSGPVHSAPWVWPVFPARWLRHRPSLLLQRTRLQ